MFHFRKKCDHPAVCKEKAHATKDLNFEFGKMSSNISDPPNYDKGQEKLGLLVTGR